MTVRAMQHTKTGRLACRYGPEIAPASVPITALSAQYILVEGHCVCGGLLKPAGREALKVLAKRDAPIAEGTLHLICSRVAEGCQFSDYEMRVAIALEAEK